MPKDSLHSIRSQEWRTLYQGFRVHIISPNYADALYSTHLSGALEFILWCEKAGVQRLGDVDGVTLNAYMDYLDMRPNRKTGRLIAPNTIAQFRNAVTQLFDYAYATGVIAYTLPFPKLIRPERKLKPVLSLDEIRLLFAACTNPRDTAILTLAYGCGLRRNEIRHLDIGDIHTHTRLLYVREGKGRKYRTIPLSNNIVSYLKQYERYYRPQLLAKRSDMVIEPAYVLTQTGHRMRGDGIYKRVMQIAIDTGNRELLAKNVTPHLLRHSVATHLIERGVSLSWVQAFLGHSKLDTTQIYTNMRKHIYH